MPNTLQITNALTVTPLIDVHNVVFAKHYRDGLCWSLSGDYRGDKPLSDTHLVANLKRDAAKGYFDGQHEDSLLYVGFYFGALHGCLLSPQTGQLRPDVTALFTCSHPDAAKGYYVGRRDCFMGTPPNERIYTDSELLEELCQIAQDLMGYPDEENSWYYSIGCVLGNLSVQVFPATSEEYQQWEAEYRQWQEQYEQDVAKVHRTESFQVVAMKEV
jgi:hypothetical protein